MTVYSPLFSPFRQPLQGESVSIGRASDCTIPIKDRYLSRKHAEIVPVGSAWMLKDLGSANGTYLNGSRVERDEPLRTGDRIRLGDTEIVFETSGASTDRFFAVPDQGQGTNPTISIPVVDLDDKPQAQDVSRLQTLTLLARELIEDRPMDELFGFISERIMEHLRPSRVAIALLGSDGRSFSKVEVRRQDSTDQSELTISHTLLSQVVQERKALAFVDVSVDEKLRRAQSIIMQGIHSILCAPLLIGDAVVGVLYVDYLFTQRAISEDDVRLVAQIGRFAAIKLETTRLREEAIQKRIMDEELKTASSIQRRLLPPAPTGIPGFTFVGRNQPCRTVSGDYFDFALRPNGKIYFVIGDVSGKGVTAGLMMAGLQVAFRIFSKSDPDPSVLVTQLNVALKENLPQSKFVTLFLGRLDTNTGAIEYVNAGHTPPLLLTNTGAVEMTESDLLLGVVSRAEFTTRHMQLDPGDSLILFTDGVTEARDEEGTDLGSTTIGDALVRLHGGDATTIAASVNETVLAHVGDAENLDDDVTLLVVSRSAL
ncbi:MAG TPA: SpoIIE family protein phosphatase [Thermoanaerobaculia bacterium]|nr:SpoIIE family protein phosphatase [Thermoanaerobaculia bacterium]